MPHPILAGIGNFGWTYAGEYYEHWRLSRLLTDVRFKIPVAKEFAQLAAFGEVQCLLVRYGEEKYLKDLGTEKDKLDGQRRLSLIPVTLSREPEGTFLEFTLPVHQYLGTQFKLFATPAKGSRVDDLKRDLDKLTTDIEDVAIGGTRQDKVYFLVKKFWPTKAEGILDGKIVNNFVAPQ